MNRSPLFYPMNRGGDGDAGGVADLQTDIMRFMAILALCLVAVFALVQSIPLAPAPEPVIEKTEPPIDEAPAEVGFTLRFESNAALTRLVARNEIGLYAITPERAMRMSVNRGAYSFWPASVPNQFHEMDAGTVPDAVVASLKPSGAAGIEPGLRWGVTLPGNMRQQLDGYLSEHASGALVIEASGNLRYEK